MTRPLTLTLALALIGCKNDEEGPPVEYDAPSSLRVDAPAQAAWLPAGTTVVSGVADNVSMVCINDEPLPYEDGAYSGTMELMRGVNVVEVEAREPDGDFLLARHAVLAGEFDDPDAMVEDAIALRINRGGLSELTAVAGSMIDLETINASLAKANPVYETEETLWSWVAADLEQITFDTMDIDLEPTAGALQIEVTLPLLEVDIFAYGEAVAIDFTQDVLMTADSVVITAELMIGAEDGTLTAELVDPEVTLNNFAYDLSSMPSFVTDYLFVDTIRSTIEETLVEQMQTMVPALLDETLSTLDFSFSTELLSTELSVAAEFASADVDSDGIALAMDVDVSVPGQGTMVYQGVLASGAGTAEVDHNAEMGMVLSDEMLNRVLFEVWRGGLMEMTLSTDDGSLEPAMLSMLLAEEGTITISADLPPVVVESEGVLQAQLGELQIVIETPGGELGELLHIAAAVYVDLDVGLDGSTLALDMGDIELALSVRDSDWGASNTTITQLVEELLPTELLTVFLGALEFELPSLYGMSFDSAVVERSESGFHTGITVGLSVDAE